MWRSSRRCRPPTRTRAANTKSGQQLLEEQEAHILASRKHAALIAKAAKEKLSEIDVTYTVRAKDRADMLRIRSEARDPGFDELLRAQMKTHGLTDSVMQTAGGELPGASKPSTAKGSATPLQKWRNTALAGGIGGVMVFIVCLYIVLNNAEEAPANKETAMEQIKTPSMYDDNAQSQNYFSRGNQPDAAATAAAASVSAYQTSGYSDGWDHHQAYMADAMRDDQQEDI